MSGSLDRLAAAAGIEPDYLTLTGDTHFASDPAKRAVLEVMGIGAADEPTIAASLAALPPAEAAAMEAPEGVACFVPEWLENGRCWGVTCQLYGLRSGRNWGIGDFEDLARFAEIAAASGADFIGVNPLHALFLADPERCSPFSPSSRDFLNPLYIAIDTAPGYEALADALQPPPEIRDGDLVDYPRVAELKKRALDRLFRVFQARAGRENMRAFEGFVVERGRSLYLHALFEALSENMRRRGLPATWHAWPEEYRYPGSEAVRAFAAGNAEQVTFHIWLQWVADRQLAAAQARARAAGVRIGLYLDLAVGVTPDGSATWCDRALTVPGARIGAPPDYFNSAGQDWGLAPLSPADLRVRGFTAYRTAIDTVLRHAGALRIDHAMSLYRLFWIAEGFGAADGVYVRYPFADMLETFAEVSQARRSIVIGEDLGVVPSGFRDVMRAVEIQGYRVFFFEKQADHFIPPDDWPREALACVTTHDLHTLAGWWSEHDLDVRAAIGMLPPHLAPAAREERAHERRRLLGLLADYGLLPLLLEPVMRAEVGPPAALPPALAEALYRLVARTPCRLLAAAAEDLTGAVEQVNIPGTMGEHPNWRRKLAVGLEELPSLPLFQSITSALREERPKPR